MCSLYAPYNIYKYYLHISSKSFFLFHAASSLMFYDTLNTKHCNIRGSHIGETMAYCVLLCYDLCSYNFLTTVRRNVSIPFYPDIYLFICLTTRSQ